MNRCANRLGGVRPAHFSGCRVPGVLAGDTEFGPWQRSQSLGANCLFAIRTDSICVVLNPLQGLGNECLSLPPASHRIESEKAVSALLDGIHLFRGLLDRDIFP